MEQIESVAADTTSEQSPPVTTHPPHQAHPHLYTHYTHSHVNKGYDLSNPPISKHPRLDDLVHTDDLRLTHKESSIPHFHKHRPKPIGIAQPFRKHPQVNKGNQSGKEDTLTKKDTIFDDRTSHLKIPHLQTLNDTPEPSDSEESQDRFDRFANESDSNTLTSKTGSEPVSLLYREQVEAKKEERMTWDDPTPNVQRDVFLEPNLPPVKNESTSLPPSQGTSGLPPGKKWVVFVSHSTSDRPWIREEIIVPLKDLKIQVAASYHYMPDQSRYDDRAIRRAMEESCVVLVALSDVYLKSERCTNEWKHAAHLYHRNIGCNVVIAKLSCCSRPAPLKQLTCLEFVDKTNRQGWYKLMEVIETAMNPLSSSSQGSYEETPKHHHHLTHRAPHDQSHSHSLTNDPHHLTDHTHKSHHPPSVSTDFSYHISDSDGVQHQQMVNDFEALYQEKLIRSSSEHMIDNDAMGDCSSIEEPTGHVIEGDDHVISANSSNVEELQGDGTDRDGVVISATSSCAEEEYGHVTEGDGHVIPEVKGDVEEGEVNDSSDETASGQTEVDQAAKVTTFYNQLAKPDADKRQESPIFYMRNFNNWVKSILIRSHLAKLSPGAIVLDLCCGKGGDLLKWKEGKISYLVCADISDVSVEAAQGRFHSDKMRRRGPVFEAEFICADCCQVRLRDKYTNAARRFHLTSCQFSIHYSFESYEKAHMMLRNACENIRPGGYFIGTTIDANQLVYRLRDAGQDDEGVWSFGNDVFSVTLDPSLDLRDDLPLFGAKYNFKLHGVVDLPEYLIHFPTFQNMLVEFDMELIQRQNFYDFFQERRHVADDATLLHRMSAFDRRTGTMKPSEWEAIGLYMVFVFQKRPLP